MGLGPHSHAQFADKCPGLSYSKRGQFYGQFQEYWRMKMWLGEPNYYHPDFVQPPTHIAYTQQLILNEPSFTEGCSAATCWIVRIAGQSSSFRTGIVPGSTPTLTATFLTS
eukprot:3242011-Rhodomonas_salina.3